MSALITPLIICGGSGTRLLPISQNYRPKQFLRLIGKHTTFQETVLRVSDPSLFGQPVIVTNHDHRLLVDNQLKELGVEADVLLEPERRGSGPAILAGTLWVAALRGPDTEILALAADHAIRNVDGFRLACRDARASAQTGSIVAFGIEPDHPAPGYGYIQRGEKLGPSAYAVARFVEKPDVESARRYLDKGYWWNVGNFLFRARSLLDEYRRYDGATADAVGEAVKKACIVANLVSLDVAAFIHAASRSIDHAVMEKTARAVVVPAMHDWLDIGTWDAIYKFLSGEPANGERSASRSFAVKPGDIRVLAKSRSQSEYWIVVGGAGIVTIAGGAKRLAAHEFIHILARVEYTIENRGDGDLQIIAVPSNIISS
jgi:mannose-1-phosphate guanylyltransferase / mannose-6-phosphate isomerase